MFPETFPYGFTFFNIFQYQIQKMICKIGAIHRNREISIYLFNKSIGIIDPVKIIIDIDNTLWDFAPVLYERMRDVSPTVTPPSEWYEFDFWKPISLQEHFTAL